MPLNPDKSNCLFIFPRPLPADETAVSNSVKFSQTLFSLTGYPSFLKNCVKKKGASAKNLTDAPFTAVR
jgi:hypothetical protein